MSKFIEITRKRQAIHREDFLVKGIGKRSMQAVICVDANTSKPASDFLSEFELYWLIVKAAEFVQKKHNWKVFVIKLPYLSDRPHSAKVFVRNASGVEYCLGDLGTFVECDHFTNDNYLCPKYFFIPKYTGAKEPWQKKRLK